MKFAIAIASLVAITAAFSVDNRLVKQAPATCSCQLRVLVTYSASQALEKSTLAFEFANAVDTEALAIAGRHSTSHAITAHTAHNPGMAMPGPGTTTGHADPRPAPGMEMGMGTVHAVDAHSAAPPVPADAGMGMAMGPVSDDHSMAKNAIAKGVFVDELLVSVILPSCGFDVTALLPTKEELSVALSVGVNDITIADENCDIDCSTIEAEAIAFQDAGCATSTLQNCQLIQSAMICQPTGTDQENITPCSGGKCAKGTCAFDFTTFAGLYDFFLEQCAPKCL